MRYRVYYNTKGDPKGEWSVDTGKGTTELNFHRVTLVGIYGTTVFDPEETGQPKGWLNVSGRLDIWEHAGESYAAIYHQPTTP